MIDTEKGSVKTRAERLDQQVTSDERKTWQAGTPKGFIVRVSPPRDFELIDATRQTLMV